MKRPSTRTLALIVAVIALTVAHIVFWVTVYRAYKFFRRVAKLPSTLSVLMALFGVGTNWEMYTIANSKNGDTFSATTRKLAEEQPVIMVFYAALGRHLIGDNPRLLAAYQAGWEAGVYWPLLDKEDVKTLTHINEEKPEEIEIT